MTALTDYQFEFEPAFPAIDDNNDFDEFAHELAGTHKKYNNDVATMIRVLGEECRIFPPAPDTELGLLTNTLGYMQEGFPHIYTFGQDEDEEDYEEDDEDYEEDEDPDNRYEVEVQYMNNMENSSPPEELQNNEEYDEYEDENLNPDMFEDEEEDDEDYSSDEDE